MPFVKLKDAQDRTVIGTLDPGLKLSAGRERLSNGDVLEAWAPRELKQTSSFMEQVAKERAEKNARLEKLRAERARQRKLKRKSQRKSR
jgi:hypothetical protein